MAVPQIPVDAPAAGAMAGVVGVRQRGALQDPEVRLDQIQPRGLGGRPDRLDPEPPQQGQESRMVVDVMQIVHDHEEPAAGVAGPQPAEGLADVDHALAAAKHPAETVGVDIIEAQELLGAVRAPIRGAHPGRPAAALPGDTADRPEFEGAPLVEADYRCPQGAPTIEPPDAFFSG